MPFVRENRGYFFTPSEVLLIRGAAIRGTAIRGTAIRGTANKFNKIPRKKLIVYSHSLFHSPLSVLLPTFAPS